MTTFDDKAFQRQLDAAKLVNTEVAQPIFDFYKKVTPKQSGNARRNTRLKVNKDTLTISAEYPYATNLDEGASKQAPNGMTEPAVKELEKLVNRFINKVGRS